MGKQTLHYYYSNHPCQGRDCKFHGGDFEEITEKPARLSALTFSLLPEAIVVWHGEICNIQEKISKIRKEIYDRADIAKEQVYLSGKYKQPWKKASKEFHRVADEWINLKCPFYEKKGKN
jgi:hypothetical protein